MWAIFNECIEDFSHVVESDDAIVTTVSMISHVYDHDGAIVTNVSRISHVVDRCGARLTNVSKISRIVDHDSAISTTVSNSPRVGGAGHGVLNFEECMGIFCSARKHRNLRYV